MNDNLSVGLDADDDDEETYYRDDAPGTDYAARVQAGIEWLTTEGQKSGYLLSNLCVHLDELSVNMPDSCVLGWASGGETSLDRANAYHDAIRRHGALVFGVSQRARGYRWGAERGFRLAEGEDHGWSAYSALTEAWKAALEPLCAKIRKEAEEA
jgi:hypothetical protein